MNRVVGSVHDPQFLFVRSQRDAVARAPVALDGAQLVSLDLHAIEFLPAAQIAHLEPEQTIDVDEAQRIAPVDRERTDDVRERSDGAHDPLTPGVCDRKKRGPQAGQVDACAIERADGIVRTRLGGDVRDDGARRRVDDVPEISFELRHVECLAVGGNRQPVTAAVVGSVP